MQAPSIAAQQLGLGQRQRLGQAGQHQPDSLAAVVVAHDVLVHSIGQQTGFASPLDTARRAREGTITSIPAWMSRRIPG